MNKLSKRPPEWHAQIAAELNREFAETNELNETARLRRIRLGMMFLFVKEMGRADKSIPHGQFGPWLELNCKGIPRSTAGDYITEAKSVFELLRWEISEIRNFEVPPFKLLAAKNDADLTAHDRKARTDLLKIVSQQSHFRAVTRYKQVELKDDATVEKAGRRKGEGGATREQREAARLADEQAQTDDMLIAAKEHKKFMDEVDNLKAAQLWPEKELFQYFERLGEHYKFYASIVRARKGDK